MKAIGNLVLAIILVSCGQAVKGAEIEIGGGALVTSLPKYIGSAEQQTYALPFPYFYYRSDNMQIDRNSFTGFLSHYEIWSLELSAAGGIPVKSNETHIRKGMADIDFVGELGPALKYYFIGDSNSLKQLNIGLNARKAFATDFSYLAAVGWHYAVTATYNTPLKSIYNGEFNLNALLSVNVADSDYLNYYYGVSEQFQTSFRPSYEAETGYSGTSLSLGLTWKKGAVWLGGFLKYHGLQGSRQQNSPLVTSDNNWSIGLGMVWIFYQNH